MIDFELEIKSIQPINIEEMKSSPYWDDDNFKKSIVLYNKAIISIQMDDLNSAVKDLKKALFCYEDFPEALKLLGLCNINLKKYKNAEKIFTKLAEYEEYRDLAIKYIQNSVFVRTMSKTMKSIEKHDNTSNDVGNNKKGESFIKNVSKRKVSIGISILSVLIAVFIISFLIGISFLGSPKNENNSTNKEVSSEMKEDKEFDKAKNSVEEDSSIKEDDKNTEKSTSNSEESSYSTELKELETESNKVKSKMSKQDIWNTYNEGNRLYKQGNYEKALPRLKEAYEVKPDDDIMPWLTYQLGNCYKELNDNDNALKLFKKVKDNYPNSRYVSSAERMIKQIENRKDN